jgi:hypothetical protein
MLARVTPLCVAPRPHPVCENSPLSNDLAAHRHQQAVRDDMSFERGEVGSLQSVMSVPAAQNPAGSSHSPSTARRQLSSPADCNIRMCVPATAIGESTESAMKTRCETMLGDVSSRPGNVRPVAQGLAGVQGAYIWGPGLYMAYIWGPAMARSRAAGCRPAPTPSRATRNIKIRTVKRSQPAVPASCLHVLSVRV